MSPFIHTHMHTLLCFRFGPLLTYSSLTCCGWVTYLGYGNCLPATMCTWVCTYVSRYGTYCLKIPSQKHCTCASVLTCSRTYVQQNICTDIVTSVVSVAVGILYSSSLFVQRLLRTCQGGSMHEESFLQGSKCPQLIRFSGRGFATH